MKSFNSNYPPPINHFGIADAIADCRNNVVQQF